MKSLKLVALALCVVLAAVEAAKREVNPKAQERMPTGFRNMIRDFFGGAEPERKEQKYFEKQKEVKTQQNVNTNLRQGPVPIGLAAPPCNLPMETTPAPLIAFLCPNAQGGYNLPQAILTPNGIEAPVRPVPVPQGGVVLGEKPPGGLHVVGPGAVPMVPIPGQIAGIEEPIPLVPNPNVPVEVGPGVYPPGGVITPPLPLGPPPVVPVPGIGIGGDSSATSIGGAGIAGPGGVGIGGASDATSIGGAGIGGGYVPTGGMNVLGPRPVVPVEPVVPVVPVGPPVPVVPVTPVGGIGVGGPSSATSIGGTGYGGPGGVGIGGASDALSIGGTGYGGPGGIGMGGASDALSVGGTGYGGPGGLGFGGPSNAMSFGGSGIGGPGGVGIGGGSNALSQGGLGYGGPGGIGMGGGSNALSQGGLGYGGPGGVGIGGGSDATSIGGLGYGGPGGVGIGGGSDATSIGGTGFGGPGGVGIGGDSSATSIGGAGIGGGGGGYLVPTGGVEPVVPVVPVGPPVPVVPIGGGVGVGGPSSANSFGGTGYGGPGGIGIGGASDALSVGGPGYGGPGGVGIGGASDALSVGGAGIGGPGGVGIGGDSSATSIGGAGIGGGYPVPGGYYPEPVMPVVPVGPPVPVVPVGGGGIGVGGPSSATSIGGTGYGGPGGVGIGGASDALSVGGTGYGGPGGVGIGGGSNALSVGGAGIGGPGGVGIGGGSSATSIGGDGIGGGRPVLMPTGGVLPVEPMPVVPVGPPVPVVPVGGGGIGVGGPSSATSIGGAGIGGPGGVGIGGDSSATSIGGAGIGGGPYVPGPLPLGPQPIVPNPLFPGVQQPFQPHPYQSCAYSGFPYLPPGFNFLNPDEVCEPETCPLYPRPGGPPPCSTMDLLDRLQLKTTARLIAASGLEGLFSQTNNYTFFAPVDPAYMALPEWFLASMESDVKMLRAFILNHFVKTDIPLYTVGDNFLVMSARPSGTRIRLNTYWDANAYKVVTADGAQVIQGDILSRTGRIHLMNKVITPSPPRNIAQYLSEVPDFSIFRSIVADSGNMGIISGEEAVTIFIPVDQAFDRFNLDRIRRNGTALNNFVKYHVVPGVFYSSGLISNQYLPTFFNKEIKVGVYTDGFQKSLAVVNNYVKVLKADIPLLNGVAHVVDSVLSPVPDFYVYQQLSEFSVMEFGTMKRRNMDVKNDKNAH